MITCITEKCLVGTVQHVETDQLELACAMFQEASKAGMEPEIFTRNGVTTLDFYASDDEYTAIIQAAYALEDKWFWEAAAREDAMKAEAQQMAIAA